MCNMLTYTWRSAKIQQNPRRLQESISLVQLYELECGSGSVSLFFRKLVILVQTALAVLLLDRHHPVSREKIGIGPVVDETAEGTVMRQEISWSYHS